MTGKAGHALNKERIRVCLHLHPFTLTFGEYFAVDICSNRTASANSQKCPMQMKHFSTHPCELALRGHLWLKVSNTNALYEFMSFKKYEHRDSTGHASLTVKICTWPKPENRILLWILLFSLKNRESPDSLLGIKMLTLNKWPRRNWGTSCIVMPIWRTAAAK